MVGAVKAAICCVPLGRVLEGLLVTIERGFHMVGVGGVSLQHKVVGDQSLGALGQPPPPGPIWVLGNFDARERFPYFARQG